MTISRDEKQAEKRLVGVVVVLRWNVLGIEQLTDGCRRGLMLWGPGFLLQEIC